MGDKPLKKIELLLKRALNKLLSSNNIPKVINSPEKIFSEINIKSILLLRHDRIGDLLISTPFVSRLRELLPDTRIDILLSKRNFPARKAVESLTNNIYVFDKSIKNTSLLIKRLNSVKYDLIIDLLDNPSTTSNAFLRFVRSDYKLGFDKKNSEYYTHVIEMPDKSKLHPAERLLNLLIPFNIRPVSSEINISYPVQKFKDMEKLAGTKHLLAINLSGSDKSRSWGEENYIKFINEFQKIYPEFEICIFTTRDNISIAKSIELNSSASVMPIYDSFNDYAESLSYFHYILTPDTSAVQLASAFKIPVVILYSYHGPEHGIQWYPKGTIYRALETTESVDKIPVQKVIDCFSELFSETNQ